MSNFIPVTNDKLAIFIKENFDALRQEFFDVWYPNITRPKLMFTWHTGERPYENKIMSAALKLSDRLLDSKEREGMAQILPIKDHMYPVRDVKPNVWKGLPTWQLLIETFDKDLEALFVNVAYPGSAINPHHGVDNHCYRMHLCLQNNKGFTFKVGGEKQKWTEGVDGMFMFDDGNLLHDVSYEELGDTNPRIVIIFDVWKEFYV